MAFECVGHAEKACKRCGVQMPLDRFPKLEQSRDGREGVCRRCKLEARGGGYVHEAQRAALRTRQARWRERHPHKKAAHRQVERAVNKGMLERGFCEVCGSGDTEAHHPDYASPLLVRWLCKVHHERLHMIADRVA